MSKERLEKALARSRELAESMNLRDVVRTLSNVSAGGDTLDRSRVIDARKQALAVSLAATHTYNAASSEEKATLAPLVGLQTSAASLCESMATVIDAFDDLIYAKNPKLDPRKITKVFTTTGRILSPTG